MPSNVQTRGHARTDCSPNVRRWISQDGTIPGSKSRGHTQNLRAIFFLQFSAQGTSPQRGALGRLSVAGGPLFFFFSLVVRFFVPIACGFLSFFFSLLAVGLFPRFFTDLDAVRIAGSVSFLLPFFFSTLYYVHGLSWVLVSRHRYQSRGIPSGYNFGLVSRHLYQSRGILTGYNLFQLQ